MAFKNIKTTQTVADTPEALILDIKHKAIPGPLSHQSDMWRSYQKFAMEKPDVAMELPTGSGKTLVGIVLAEWRRKKFNEKIVYLCPTKQLVNQVVDQAINKYKINVSGFTGRKSEYSTKDKLAFQNAESIAITTYSGLFNANPFFENIDIIILDDSHSAENYIGKYWSLDIGRFDIENGGSELYKAFASLIKSKLSPTNEKRMLGSSDDMDYEWVDKLSTKEFLQLHEPIYALLNHYCTDGSLMFQWNTIKEHLHACNCYLSSTSILIRPLLPPTSTLKPFNNAKQRIYMSATLGHGGDLERITGRKNIYRLPIPEGWDKQGIGRRFFIFPERSLDDNEVKTFIDTTIQKAGRSVYLVPENKIADQRKKHIEEKLSMRVFNAQELEVSKDSFLAEHQAVALLSNRYDGIDFPDDASRMLIIEGLPTATNLQERFFVSRMAAKAILEDRIMTRLLQAMGRCTRSLNDYSAVIVLGEKLITYMQSEKNRSSLHPEQQAELLFGLDQSKEQSIQGFEDNISYFLGQTNEWREADEMISELRHTCTKKVFTYTENLKLSVDNEINYQERLWHGDYIGAATFAKEVFETLTDPELKGYRALWSYFIGSAYDLQGGEYVNTAKSHYKRAMTLAPSLKWLIDLARHDIEFKESLNVESQLSHIFEKFEKNISKFGLNKKYKEIEERIIQNLHSNDGKIFEHAQTELGNLIGYDAYNEETKGAPDPIWMLNNKLCIVFEDYSEADKNSKLTISKARQVDGHDKWIKEFMDVDKDIEIIKILVTDAQQIDGKAALAHLKDVYLWKKSDFITWSLDVLARLKPLHAEFSGQGSLFWRNQVIEEFKNANLIPEILIKQVKTKSAYDYYQSTI